MKRYLPALFTILISCLLFSVGKATNLRVGILTAVKPSSLIVLPSFGAYEVYGNGKKIMELKSGSFVNLKLEKNGINIKNFDHSFGTYSSIRFVGIGGKNVFRIKSVNPATDTHTFDGNLEIVNRGYLRPINNVNIEDYVAGVVEAEAGKNAVLEFLKLQAIICRTYALGLTNRHPGEGYQMCDNVHCQVYKGKARFNPDVITAVNLTRGKVIADANLQLITAAFHSNCGGYTVNSEDVWGSPLPYLRSVRDTFCYKQPHSTWEKKIPVYDWMRYISLKSKRPDYFGQARRDSFNYLPPQREHTYAYQELQVPFKFIRSDWGLRSGYFNIQERNDTLILKGAGFGHGVGLCQEGAMRMAEIGFTYHDIINFYYKDVGVISIENLRFFKQD